MIENRAGFKPALQRQGAAGEESGPLLIPARIDVRGANTTMNGILRPIRFQRIDFELKFASTLTWFPGQWSPKKSPFHGLGRHGPASQFRDSWVQCSTLVCELA
jgi:hypothetical protein